MNKSVNDSLSIPRGARGGVLLCIACLIIQSCGSIHTGLFSPLPDRESLSVITSIQEKNNSLFSFKGIGKIELVRGEGAFIARTAWMGLYPDRFRMEILAMSGQPLISISAVQDHFYYLSHTDSTYFEKNAPGATLEELSSIPVKIEDVMEFLIGRVPIREHATSTIERSDSDGGYIVILKENWTGITEKIYLDEKKTKIYKVEIFGITGALSYRAELTGEIMIDGFSLPSRVVLSNESGDSVQWRIDRYFANVPVEHSMFLIPPPEEKE
ncbi:MAG: hypothetical protein C4522_00340 [Desulfobacteraceae bacterium]|nr:MAG: hypothetical protein C4522_00340 [Desulfobacteraceae bacterium]